MDSEPHSRLLNTEFSFILLIQHYFMLYKNVMQKNIQTQHSLETPHSAQQKALLLFCQARVQVQGLSQISNKRPGPGACSYNCNVSTTTHPP